jgi:hypothetical protein
MKTIPVRFLQAVVVAIGIAAIALLIWEPQIEGRNANATLFEIYFTDPFLAFAYVASIPFFMGLYQAFRLLGLAGCDRLFSPDGVGRLRTIKYSAMAMVGFVVVGEVWILLQTSDDRAGGVFMGALIAGAAVVVAAAASVIERALKTCSPQSLGG